MSKITKNKYLGSYRILNYMITKGQIKKAFKSKEAIKIRNALIEIYKKVGIDITYGRKEK